jgi:tight adherence protein B
MIFTAAGSPALLTLVAMAAAGAIPYGFVWLRVRRRLKAFENQLPDLLTTIAASLKAGHSFKHGLQAVVDESQPPASVELRRALTEAGLGRPLDDALGDMAERLGSENFAFAITAVTIQRQVGGSLATLFDMVSETVRNRQQFARKIRSLTAMGRMSAYTLVGVPFFIGAMVSVLNPSYMSPLFHSHFGHILLFLGVGMMIVGSLVLKKKNSVKGKKVREIGPMIRVNSTVTEDQNIHIRCESQTRNKGYYIMKSPAIRAFLFLFLQNSHENLTFFSWSFVIKDRIFAAELL